MTPDPPATPDAPVIARVRFLRSGAVICLDAARQRIESLCTPTGIYAARPHVPRILDAVRAQTPRPVLEEQRWGRFWPLTEMTLARFEGRDPVGDRLAVVNF